MILTDLRFSAPIISTPNETDPNRTQSTPAAAPGESFADMIATYDATPGIDYINPEWLASQTGQGSTPGAQALLQQVEGESQGINPVYANWGPAGPMPNVLGTTSPANPSVGNQSTLAPGLSLPSGAPSAPSTPSAVTAEVQNWLAEI